jgi:hypothetical protein
MKIKSLFALAFSLLISLLEIINTPVSGQQIKINSGTFLNYSGSNISVNGKIDNSGTIRNSGVLGLRVTGNLQNSGTFVAGTANHKIGGNFSNNGTFNGELAVKRVFYIMIFNAQARVWQPIFETIPAAKHMLFYQYPTTI